MVPYKSEYIIVKNSSCDMICCFRWTLIGMFVCFSFFGLCRLVCVSVLKEYDGVKSQRILTRSLKLTLPKFSVFHLLNFPLKFSLFWALPFFLFSSSLRKWNGVKNVLCNSIFEINFTCVFCFLTFEFSS